MGYVDLSGYNDLKKATRITPEAVIAKFKKPSFLGHSEVAYPAGSK